MNTQSPRLTAGTHQQRILYVRLHVGPVCPPPPPLSSEHKGFLKRKLNNIVRNALKMISPFHISCSWFLLYPPQDCVNLQKTHSPFPSAVLHFKQSVHFSPKCWAAGWRWGSTIITTCTEKCDLNITKEYKNYVSLNKKGLPVPPTYIKFLRKLSG